MCKNSKKFTKTQNDFANFLVRQMRRIDPSVGHMLLLIDNQLRLVAGHSWTSNDCCLALLSAQDLLEGLTDKKWIQITNTLMKLNPYPKF